MAEMGWFGSKAVRKVAKKAKVVRKVARKIYAPISAVERVVRPVGKKIPIVGTFAQLHEDITEPFERRVLGLKPAAKISKNRAGAGLASGYAEIASTLASSDALVGAAAVGAKLLKGGGLEVAGKAFSRASPAFRKVVALGRSRRVDVARALVRRAKTDPMAARAVASVRKALGSAIKAKPGVALAKATRGVYTVIAPDGRKVLVPVSAVG